MSLPARACRVRRTLVVVMSLVVAALGACSGDDGSRGAPSGDARSVAATSSTTDPSPSSDVAGSVMEGTWGSERAIFTFSEEGLRASFECATGGSTGPVRLDGDGRFEVRGWYSRDEGGPGSASESPTPRDEATYSGERRGERLEVVVDLDDGARHGPFRVALGADVALERCV